MGVNFLATEGKCKVHRIYQKKYCVLGSPTRNAQLPANDSARLETHCFGHFISHHYHSIHARFVPALRGLFAYNFMSVLAFASILMTYFGVNFHLSGLHSLRFW